MKILVFSDIHGDLAALQRLMDTEADGYFAAGDLASWSRGLEAACRVLAQRSGRVWVLPGNHETEEQVEQLCRQYGLNPFHGRTVEMAGYHIAGLGYSSPTPFNTPGEYSEEELARRLACFAELDPMVLICHCPPHGTALDRVREDLHAGSLAVAEFIQAHQPEHFICGHIHEAEGTGVLLGATQGHNAGKRGYLLDFDKLSA